MENTEHIKPNYYTQGRIEPWDFIKSQGLDFFAGNVVKYVCRYKMKNGLEDLKKARTYLDKMINDYENVGSH